MAETIKFPTTRFVADKDDKGAFIKDKNGELKSGTFEIQLFEQDDKSNSRLLGMHKESVSFTKFRALREEVDELSVDQLVEMFPDLDQDALAAKAKEEREAEEAKAAEEARVAAEKAKADEKAAAAERAKTAGQANGKSGSEKTEQKSTPASQADVASK